MSRKHGDRDRDGSRHVRTETEGEWERRKEPDPEPYDNGQGGERGDKVQVCLGTALSDEHKTENTAALKMVHT